MYANPAATAAALRRHTPPQYLTDTTLDAVAGSVERASGCKSPGVTAQIGVAPIRGVALLTTRAGFPSLRQFAPVSVAAAPAPAPVPSGLLDHLSPRQREIAPLIAAGHFYKQIAHALGISEGTVKVHAEAIGRRLGCRGRAAIAAKLAGLVPKVGQPGARLTPMETRVAQLVAEGLTVVKIAATLGIAEGTVKLHQTSARRKVGVANRSGLAAWVRQNLPAEG